eukprot:149448_1
MKDYSMRHYCGSAEVGEQEPLAEDCDFNIRFYKKEQYRLTQSELLVHGYITTEIDENIKMNIIPEPVINLCLQFYHKKKQKYPDGCFDIKLKKQSKKATVHRSNNSQSRNPEPSWMILCFTILIWLMIFGWIFDPSIMRCHWMMYVLQYGVIGAYLITSFKTEPIPYLTNIQTTNELHTFIANLKNNINQTIYKPTVTLAVRRYFVSSVSNQPGNRSPTVRISYEEQQNINIEQWKNETEWFNVDDFVETGGHSYIKIVINKQQKIYFMDSQSDIYYKNAKREMVDACLRQTKDCNDDNISFNEYISYENNKQRFILFRNNEYKDWRISIWFYIICTLLTFEYFYLLWFKKKVSVQQNVKLKLSIKISHPYPNCFVR